MNLEQICRHERANMKMRYIHGYENHDAHIWVWLLYHLCIWSKKHQIQIGGPPWPTSTNSK